MTLEEWIPQKREELKRLRVDTRGMTPTIRDFTQAVLTQRRGLSVIAEIARATPEEGPLASAPDIEAIAAACDQLDVAAVAVATDAIACGGSPADLIAASKATSSPILQRDLILTRDQLYQARQCQADASLLIAAALTAGELKLLIDLAASTHVPTPVEVRSEEELRMAVAAGARLVVVPAFDGARLSLSLAQKLLPLLPRTAAGIVRGPFADAADLKAVRGKADGIWLCGPLMRATDPAAFLRPLIAAADGE